MPSGVVLIKNQADKEPGIDIIEGTGQSIQPLRIFDVNGNLVWAVGVGGGNVSSGQAVAVAFNPASPYSATGKDYFIGLDATAGLVVVTLPPAAVAAPFGLLLRIMKTDGTANAVSIRTSAGDTINTIAGGPSSYLLTGKGETVFLVSNGVTGWFSMLAGPSWGGALRKVTTTTAQILSDCAVTFDATGGAITYTLLAAASVPAGTQLRLEKIDAGGNAITVTRAGADQIESGGALGNTISLAAQFNKATISSDGVATWFAI